jgi:hypothetical protein
MHISCGCFVPSFVRWAVLVSKVFSFFILTGGAADPKKTYKQVQQG